MRTVHETEARPDKNLPLLGGPTPASKLQRIKLKLSQPKDDAASVPDTDTDLPAEKDKDKDTDSLGLSLDDFEFDEDEKALPPRDLYRLLRRQVSWAERDAAKLRAEWEDARPRRKQAWLEKEAILDRWLADELEFSVVFNQVKRKAEKEAEKEAAEARLAAAAEAVAGGVTTIVDVPAPAAAGATAGGDPDTTAVMDEDDDDDDDDDEDEEENKPDLVDLEVQRWAREFQEKQQSARRSLPSSSVEPKPEPKTGGIPRPAGDV